MADLQPLAGGGEHHRVHADLFAAAQGGEADLAGRPRAGMAVAALAPDIFQPYLAAGSVKSITTSAAPMAVAASDTIFTPLAPTPATSPASRPSALLAAPSMAPDRVQPSVWAICRISIWPMRPEAPAMAIFISFPPNYLA